MVEPVDAIERDKHWSARHPRGREQVEQVRRRQIERVLQQVDLHLDRHTSVAHRARRCVHPLRDLDEALGHHRAPRRLIADVIDDARVEDHACPAVAEEGLPHEAWERHHAATLVARVAKLRRALPKHEVLRRIEQVITPRARNGPLWEERRW